MEGANSEETMKLGMRLKSSIFVLGACVALSGFTAACGDDTDSTDTDSTTAGPVSPRRIARTRGSS